MNRLILCLILMLFTIFTTVFLMSKRGRTLIYNDGSRIASGLGEKYQDHPSRYYLVSKSDNTKIHYILSEDIAKYDKELYEITYVPEHNSMEYVVGYFQQLEDIDGSDDIYLTIDLGGQNLTRYRLVLDNEMTVRLYPKSSFAIESVLTNKNGNRNVRSFTPSSVKGGVEKIKKQLDPGDVLVVIPQYKDEYFLVADEANIVVADFVVLRRMFGYPEFRFSVIFK